MPVARSTVCSHVREMLDPAAFIIANTKLLSPPLLPEIRLHLADESVAVWQKTEDALGLIDSAPPYWAFAWAGGQALARYLLDTPALVAGQRVLDLGSGSGLSAIAAAKAGAAFVLANDIDPMSLAATTLNAAANGVMVATSAQDLILPRSTTGESTRRRSDEQPFGVIMVGDLFYERQLAENVLAYIETAVANGATVLIGDPQRNYFPKGRFTTAAEYSVPVTRELEDAEFKLTTVWCL